VPSQYDWVAVARAVVPSQKVRPVCVWHGKKKEAERKHKEWFWIVSGAGSF
jgi:hypothetical protein